MKLSFNEIKEKFEHKDYLERDDFIANYDFEDEYKEYYRAFIIENDKIKYPIYLSSLIDICGYLNFDDDVLYSRIFNYLFAKNDMLIKDATFDYLKRIDRFYEDKQAEERLNLFINSHAPKLRKLRDVLILMAYQLLIELKVYHKQFKEADIYFAKYCNHIKNTLEPVVLIRARQEAHREPLLKKYKKEINKLVKATNTRPRFKLELEKYSL